MRKYWDPRSERLVQNVKVDAFLDEIEAVCRKHGFTISHEMLGECECALFVCAFSERKAEVLRLAELGEGVGPCAPPPPKPLSYERYPTDHDRVAPEEKK